MWKRIVAFFEHVGRVRAAAEFARMGKHDIARKIMTENSAF
jgi:hypothetical protein